MNPLDTGIGGCPADGLLAAMRAALRSAPAVARDDPFPQAWWQHLAGHDMLGVGFDAEGGACRADWLGIAALAGVIAHETGRLGLALAWLINEMLGRFVIGGFPGNDHHRPLLRLMAQGRKIVALAISEPKAGAHPKLLQCSARRTDGQWLLDGDKAWVSNGPVADAFVVVAVTGEDSGRKHFDAFVVDADAAGLSRTPAGAAVLPPLGHCGLSLLACAVADARRLDAGGDAFERIAKPMRALEDSLLAGATVGAMRAELEALARHARDPAPDTVARLGALRLELQAIETLAAECARELGRHGPGEHVADLNAGLRIVLQRWQAACETFAAALVEPSAEFSDLASDVRAVLGIARRVSEARHMKAGLRMISSKETHEVPA